MVNTVLEHDNLSKLEDIMYPKHMKAGSYLFWEGDETGKLYYLRSGKARLTRTTEEGKDLILSILEQGDLIGELDGDGASHHSYNAEVTEDAEIGVIQQKDLEIILYQHGDFAIQFMRWMGLMNRVTESKFRDLMLFGKQGALASTLIRMSNTYGEKLADGIHVKHPFSNSDIANMIGATRESVNRMLSAFKSEGVIQSNHGELIIKDITHLRSLCNCPMNPPCPREICRL